MIGTFVIVRTCNAGVHCGELASQRDQQVMLKNARRVWRWRGANTLHELALSGGDMSWTRISEPVDQILLLDAIEVIATTSEAKANLEQSRWPS